MPCSFLRCTYCILYHVPHYAGPDLQLHLLPSILKETPITFCSYLKKMIENKSLKVEDIHVIRGKIRASTKFQNKCKQLFEESWEDVLKRAERTILVGGEFPLPVSLTCIMHSR